MLPDIENLAKKYYNNYDNHHAKVFYVSEKYAPNHKTRQRLIKQVMYLTLTKLIKRGVIPARFGDVVIIKGYNICKYGFIYDGRDLRNYDAYRKTNQFNVWRIHPSTGVFINSHYWSHIFGSMVKIRPNDLDLINYDVHDIRQITPLSINGNICIINVPCSEFIDTVIAYRRYGWSREYYIKDKINVLYQWDL